MEPHFLQYNNGTKDFIHQILTDDDEECSKKAGEVITLQSVLENSFKLWGDLKLLQRPNPAFLIQFPRSDGDMIHFDGILPNKFLNFGGILDKSEKYVYNNVCKYEGIFQAIQIMVIFMLQNPVPFVLLLIVGISGSAEHAETMNYNLSGNIIVSNA